MPKNSQEQNDQKGTKPHAPNDGRQYDHQPDNRHNDQIGGSRAPDAYTGGATRDDTAATATCFLGSMT
jgi:hypothetical protein